MGSDASHFNVSAGSDGHSHSRDSVHKPQPFWRERRAEAVSNRGRSAYQPNALPLDAKPAHNMRLRLGSLLTVSLEDSVYQCNVPGTEGHGTREDSTWINPFSAPACSISGMKDALTRLKTVYFSVSPITHLLFSATNFDENRFTCQSKKRKDT